MSAPIKSPDAKTKDVVPRRGRRPKPARAMINVIAKEGGKRQHYFSVVLAALPIHVMRAIQDLAGEYMETGLFAFQKRKKSGACPSCGREE